MPVEKTIIHDLGAAVISDCEAILCDLDGCLIAGDHVFPNTQDFVEAHADRLWIVSNNSSDTAETLSRRIGALGLFIEPERILLAGEQAVRRIAVTRPGASVSIYGAMPIQALASALGLRFGGVDPEVVLLARDAEFNLQRLSKLLGELHRGADFIVTNIDTAHPDADGRPVPETGAILAAIHACEPAIRFQTIGKPKPDLVEIALEKSGADAAASVFIGDNESTDGKAADAAGVAFLHLSRKPVNGTAIAGAAYTAAGQGAL